MKYHWIERLANPGTAYFFAGKGKGEIIGDGVNKPAETANLLIDKLVQKTSFHCDFEIGIRDGGRRKEKGQATPRPCPFETG